MAAFNYTQPPDATGEKVSYSNRTYSIQVYNGSTGSVGLGAGPIPYCTRFSPSGSVSFLYIQTDRVLISSGAMTTTTNYTIQGVSAPTVTAVTFTTGKKFVRLTLSGTLTTGKAYTLSVADRTFTDGADSVYNITTATPIYVDITPTQNGVDQTIAVGTPVMS